MSRESEFIFRIRKLEHFQLCLLSIAGSELLWPLLSRPHPDVPISGRDVSILRHILDSLWLIVKAPSNYSDGEARSLFEQASEEVSRLEAMECSDPLQEDATVSVYWTCQVIAKQDGSDIEGVKWAIMRVFSAADYIAFLQYPRVMTVTKEIATQVENGIVCSSVRDMIDKYIEMTASDGSSITREFCMSDAIRLDSIFKTVKLY